MSSKLQGREVGAETARCRFPWKILLVLSLCVAGWSLFRYGSTRRRSAGETGCCDQTERESRVRLNRLLDGIARGRSKLLPRLVAGLRRSGPKLRRLVLERAVQRSLSRMDYYGGDDLQALLSAFPKEVFDLLTSRLSEDEPDCLDRLRLVAALYVNRGERSWRGGVTPAGLAAIHRLMTVGLESPGNDSYMKIRDAAVGLVCATGDRRAMPFLKEALEKETVLERRLALSRIVKRLERALSTSNPSAR